VEQTDDQSSPKAILLVICGPIASGKSTVARAVARLFQDQGADAAAIDLDLVYGLLEHQGAPKEGLPIWSRARRAAAALTDALLDDGGGVIVVEGDFLLEDERAAFSRALRSSVKPVFATLHVSIDVALERVQMDSTRGISRDPSSSAATTNSWNKPFTIDPQRTSYSTPLRSMPTKLLAQSRSGGIRGS